MSTFKLKDMLEADAYLSLSYEYTDTGGTLGFGPTTPVIVGPFDFGESGGYWDIIQAYHYTGHNVRTVIYVVNLGHIMPMEWSVQRSIYDLGTDALISADTLTFTLIGSASFTLETDGLDTYALFSADPPVIAPA